MDIQARRSRVPKTKWKDFSWVILTGLRGGNWGQNARWAQRLREWAWDHLFLWKHVYSVSVGLWEVGTSVALKTTWLLFTIFPMPFYYYPFSSSCPVSGWNLQTSCENTMEALGF